MIASTQQSLYHEGVSPARTLGCVVKMVALFPKRDQRVKGTRRTYSINCKTAAKCKGLYPATPDIDMNIKLSFLAIPDMPLHSDSYVNN